jgi:hypothetical protein
MSLVESILVSVCPMVAYPLGVYAQQAIPMTTSAAQGFEGKWHGDMSCAMISLAKGPQKSTE